jgi:16S rRNA processing protein RimM
MKKEFLECGKIVGAHGVKGLMKVESWCDTPKVLAAQKRVFFAEKDGSYKEAEVISASVSGSLVLMHVGGLDTREEAQALKNRIIYLRREDIPLPKGAMFIADMIGLPVFHAESGESLGTLSDVNDVAGRRIYSVNYMGREVLIPDVPEFIKEISEEGGMRVMPIPGLFDSADEV